MLSLPHFVFMAHFGLTLSHILLFLLIEFIPSNNMGNCLTNNKVSAQDQYENFSAQDQYENFSEAKVEHMKKTSPSSKLEAGQCMKKKKKKKKVRFNIQNDDEGDRGSHGDSRSGTVRIRVVMTREELKRMLSCKGDDSQHISLEQLLGTMKLRGGTISGVGDYDDGAINSWRPALDSIPEDRLIK